MIEENGVVVPAPEQAEPAPAVAETTKPEASVADADAAPDQAETTETTETEQSEGNEDSPAKPKLTRNQRLQRKAARLSTMLAEQQAELESLRAERNKADTDSEPKEADYNGDWTRYQAEYAAWKAGQVIERKLSEREQRETAQRTAEQVREANEDFLERVEELKPKIPDYDEAIQAFAKSGGQFAPHLIEEIRDSENGPVLAYHLAKNPHLAAELNAMSARDAAREIGRLERSVSLPQPKKQTQAPAPLAAVKGGASASKDIYKLANSDNPADMAAYVKLRDAQDAAARRR